MKLPCIPAFLFLLLFSLTLGAQEAQVTVKGRVLDKATLEAVPFATLQLCHVADTSFVVGCTTGDKGVFTLPKAAQGSYLLCVSCMGYEPVYLPLKTVGKGSVVTLPDISIEQNSIALNEAVISANLAPVQSVEDTVVFNAAAFRVPEGSMLEDLLKKLPGAELSDNGTLTINGKTISMILVDGKEFFVGDMAVATKNIPVSMIEKLKTYDRQSDKARITGVEDDEEQTVLDIKVKRDMTRGYFNNLALSGGSDNLYSMSTNLNRFVKKDKYTLIGNTRNVEGPRSNSNGNSKHGQAAFNFIKETEHLESSGNVNYNHNSSTSSSGSTTERFLSTRNSYSSSLRHGSNSSDGVNAQVKLEWKPDSLWNILMNPNFSYNKNESSGNNRSGTFKLDPYAYSGNPLDDFEKEGVFPDSSRVNYSHNESCSSGHSVSTNMQLQVNRRFAKKGRNATLNINTSYGDQESSSFSRATTHYYLKQGIDGNDSVLYRNRYVPAPSHDFSTSAQVSYVEPILDRMYLQGYYKFTYRNNWNDRNTYDLASYVDYTLPLDYLPDDYGRPDSSLSKRAEYDNYIHEGQLSFRISQKKLKLSVGLRYNLTTTRLSYKQSYIDTVVSRTVADLSPNIVFRYRFDRTTNLKITYWSRSSQPSMTDLLPVRDERDPMNVWVGNPGLKPTFQGRLTAQYDTYNADKQRGMNLYLQGEMSRNSISNKVEYDEESGASVRTPANINGNWSLNANAGFNTALHDKRFTLNSHTSGQLRNQAGYLRTGSQSDSQKNNIRTADVSQRLSARFRGDWLELSLNGSFNYNTTHNELKPGSNLDVYRYSYGGEVFVRLPLNFSFNSDIQQSSRRGYDNAAFNTDELLWNMQFSYKFLKQKQAVLSLNFYDILNRQSNITRRITASSRSDSWQETIHSYWMLNFTYKLNIFGV